MKAIRYFLLFFSAVIAIAGPRAFWAQSKAVETGSIAGTLSDSSGSPLAEASVVVAQVAAKQTSTPSLVAKTDKAGTYKLEVPAGKYTVRYSLDGFKATVVENVTVRVGDLVNVSTRLEFGSMTETVTVPWQGDADPEDSVKAIPLAARNYTVASSLASGVSSTVNNATAIGINTQGVKVGSGTTNNYLTDGAPVAASTGSADTPGIPNPDAIQSYEVQSWTYSAGPERNAGANIIVVTKSGSNEFHGSMWEFVRNEDLNANEFFLKSKRLPRPVLKQNQFGFTLGGPIVKNRALIFTSYQGTRQRNGIDRAGFASNVTLPPVPSTRDAATLGAAFCPANHPGDKRYQTAFGGVQVACDGSNVNPVAVNILNLKLANGNYLIPGSSNGGFETIPYSVPAKFQEDQFIINADYVLSQKYKLTQKLFRSRASQVSNFTSGSSALPGTPSAIEMGQIYGVVKLNSTFTPLLLNEFRISGQRDLLSNTPSIPWTNDQVGITSVVPQINLLDELTVYGLFNIGGNGTWDANFVNQYQVADQISWMRGKHTIRAGFEADRRQWNVHVLGQSMGSLIFQKMGDFLIGLPGCPPNATGCTGSNSAVEVNGITTNGSSFSNVFASYGPGWNLGQVTGPNGVSHTYRFSDYSAYLQDEFRLTPRLTVTAGIRWEYSSLPSDSSGHSTSFWSSRAVPWQAPPTDGTYAGYVVPSNYNGPALPSGVFQNTRRTPLASGAPKTNFAPRVAFSLQPLGRGSLVIRGGFGLFYDRPDAWLLNQQSLAMPPYAVPVGGAGAANYSATFARPFTSRTLGWQSAIRTADLSTGSASSVMVNALDEHFTTPLTQKWNLDIQQQLPHGLLVAIGYYGAHSVHLQNSMRHINGARLASASSPINGITTNTVANAALRVPYLGIAPNGLNEEQTQGAAKYHSLQATLQARFNFGLRLKASYRFSKTMTNIGVASNSLGIPFGLAMSAMNSNDPLDARQQYGPAVLGGMASPQRLSVNYSWDFPWKFAGVTGKLIGGWGISGVTFLQAGAPMTITDSRGSTIYGNAGTSRAQFCPGKGPRDVTTSGSVKERLNGWFNASAFCAPPAIGDGAGYGNTSVGFVRGPAQNNTDISIIKTIPIVGESKLELRAEFFNAFNHPQFSNPNLNVPDPPFGKITGTSVNPRLIQLAMKYTF